MKRPIYPSELFSIILINFLMLNIFFNNYPKNLLLSKYDGFRNHSFTLIIFLKYKIIFILILYFKDIFLKYKINHLLKLSILFLLYF